MPRRRRRASNGAPTSTRHPAAARRSPRSARAPATPASRSCRTARTSAWHRRRDDAAVDAVLAQRRGAGRADGPHLGRARCHARLPRRRPAARAPSAPPRWSTGSPAAGCWRRSSSIPARSPRRRGRRTSCSTALGRTGAPHALAARSRAHARDRARRARPGDARSRAPSRLRVGRRAPSTTGGRWPTVPHSGLRRSHSPIATARPFLAAATRSASTCATTTPSSSSPTCARFVRWLDDLDHRRHDVSTSFPDGFLWGAATAPHQVEGGNVNSDMWELEWATPSIFAEPSGDACDHYHRYAEDIATHGRPRLQRVPLRRRVGAHRARGGLVLARRARPLPPHVRDLRRARHHAGRHLQPLLVAAVVLPGRRLGGRRRRPTGSLATPRRSPSISATWCPGCAPSTRRTSSPC